MQFEVYWWKSYTHGQVDRWAGDGRNVRIPLHWQLGYNQCTQRRSWDHEELGPWTAGMFDLHFTSQKSCQGIRLSQMVLWRQSLGYVPLSCRYVVIRPYQIELWKNSFTSRRGILPWRMLKLLQWKKEVYAFTNVATGILKAASCILTVDMVSDLRFRHLSKTYLGVVDRIIQTVWLLHPWEYHRNSQLEFPQLNHTPSVT